jgi:Mrp family chromosome partitioning ATPase
VANDLSGCIPVASVLDGVLLVIAAGKVPAAKAVAAKRQLELARAHVIGVVLNKKRFYVPRFLRCLIPFANHE